jgi:hypothetical protein
MQVQEQQKKNACVKSLHTKQDSLHTRLCELQDSLDSMKGCLYNEKSKRCKDIFDEETKVAEAKEKVVRQKYFDAVSDAQTRLHKWRQERDKRREAENKMAEQDTHAKTKKQHEMYTHLLEDFNEITADPKSSMQREWDDEETAQKNGGKQGWPPWVVQLICELLVTGTPPGAIPQTIQTFCKTLV